MASVAVERKKSEKRYGRVFKGSAERTLHSATHSLQNDGGRPYKDDLSSTQQKLPNRTAIKVSYDQNFDDIYNRRFRKYCMLLAKEKELLRRMGKVRTLNASMKSQDYMSSYDDDDGDDDYNNAHIRGNIGARRGERQYASLKDLRKLRPSVTQDHYKRLSTSYEQVPTDEGGDYNDDNVIRDEDNEDGSDDAQPPASDHPRMRRPRSSAPHFLYQQTGNRASLNHSHSCEGTDFTDFKGNYSDMTKTQSFDTQEVVEMMQMMTNPTVQRSQSTRSTTSSLRHHDISGGHSYYQSKMRSETFNPSSSPPMASSLRHAYKNSLMTSSTRDLSDRNVRDIKTESVSLRSHSPTLQRRLAEANLRKQKRDEVLKSLDSDFNKAKEIMEKYKSTENLARYNSISMGDLSSKPKSMSVQNLLIVPTTEQNNITSDNNKFNNKRVDQNEAVDHEILENGGKEEKQDAKVVKRRTRNESKDIEKLRRRRSWTYL